MAAPIIEQIAVKIKAKLEEITIANGYQQDVAEVVRPTRTGGFKERHLLIVMTQEDPTEGEPAQRMKQWNQRFVLDCYVVPSETDTDAVETTINTFRSDVEKALMTLLADDTFRGPLAENVTIRPPIGFVSIKGAFEGVTVAADVTYDHLETDPYSKT